MPQIRYTVADLKSNLKFLFLLSLILTVLTLVIQVILMRLENKAQLLSIELEQTEAQVSQLRSGIFLLHTKQPTERSIVFEEIRDIEHSMIHHSELAVLLGDDYKRVMNYFEQLVSTVTKSNPTHDEEICYEIGELLKKRIEYYRIESSTTRDSLYQKINVLNLLIASLPMAVAAMLFYSLYFSLNEY